MHNQGTPPVQFGPGGEQWWQIPAGAAIAASDGGMVGSVRELGTTYMRVAGVAGSGEDFYLPLQIIGGYDARQHAVHLTVPAATARAMGQSTPASDPLSFQAVGGTAPTPPVQPPSTVREFAIPLREQTVIVTPLPIVTKEVTVRRAIQSGQVTVTETVRREEARVEGEGVEISPMDATRPLPT